MRERIRNEEGIALVMALGITVVLIIFVTSMISYTTSSQRGANIGSADLQAREYAEGGLNSAYSMIVDQATASGNPTAANLFGCSGVSGPSDTTAPSNCASPTPKVVCLTGAGCTSGSVGSARVFGYFSGTNPGSYNGSTVAASTWLLVATGFARNPDGVVTAKTTTATVHVSALDNGAVAAIWNHIFMTKPYVPNVCQVSFGGNNTLITSPLYVVGNLCLTGQNVAVQQAAGGQPIDLMVGGKLSLSGSGSKVGTDSTHPIYSGVVQLGCTNGDVTTATGSCGSGAYNYWSGITDTWVDAKAPAVVSGDIAADYASFDPGPNHPCATGGLPSSTFDNNTIQNNSAATFELVPTSSYTCISQNGASVGQLTWNNSTKQLTINGNVFIDGSMTVSQSATYTGTGDIEVAGTITFNGNATQLCATATTPCDFTNWQGSSTNKSMLTLVALAQNTTSFSFTNNSQTFQGSLWTDPTSTMTFVKNGVTLEGPISVGGFDATFNNAAFKPLPIITNMPTGAPLPPNTGVNIGSLTITH